MQQRWIYMYNEFGQNFKIIIYFMIQLDSHL